MGRVCSILVSFDNSRDTFSVDLEEELFCSGAPIFLRSRMSSEKAGISPLRNTPSFRDILEERRRTSDVVWITREWNPVRTVRDAAATNPLSIRKAVLNSTRVKETVKQVQ